MLYNIFQRLSPDTMVTSHKVNMLGNDSTSDYKLKPFGGTSTLDVSVVALTSVMDFM